MQLVLIKLYTIGIPPRNKGMPPRKEPPEVADRSANRTRLPSSLRTRAIKQMPTVDDHRNRPRYGVQCELWWKLTSRKEVRAEGSGRTIEISSNALHFEAS